MTGLEKKPMRLRLTKIDEFQFLTCIQHQLWGSKTARFKDWKVGDHLVFIVDKKIGGLAKVSGEPFVSDKVLWKNSLYPHRIPIEFVRAMVPEHRPPVLGKIRDAITSVVGPRYGWFIFKQHPFSGNVAKTIIDYILSQPNDLKQVQASLKRLLSEAKSYRDARSKLERIPGASQ
jgi:hypothetical protein